MFKKFVEFSYDDTSMINHDPERFRPRGDNSVKPNLKIPGSKDISESGAGQKSRWLGSIGNVDDRFHWMEHFEVDNSINGDSDRVFCQNFLRRNIKSDSSKVHDDNVINTGDDKK